MRAYRAGTLISFDFTNSRGKKSRRRGILLGINYGDNEEWPRGWFIYCFDIDKKDFRSFPVTNVDGENMGATG